MESGGPSSDFCFIKNEEIKNKKNKKIVHLPLPKQGGSYESLGRFSFFLFSFFFLLFLGGRERQCVCMCVYARARACVCVCGIKFVFFFLSFFLFFFFFKALFDIIDGFHFKSHIK